MSRHITQQTRNLVNMAFYIIHIYTYIHKFYYDKYFIFIRQNKIDTF